LSISQDYQVKKVSKPPAARLLIFKTAQGNFKVTLKMKFLGKLPLKKMLIGKGFKQLG